MYLVSIRESSPLRLFLSSPASFLDGQLYLRVERLAAIVSRPLTESKTLTDSLLGDSSPKITYSLLDLEPSHECS